MKKHASASKLDLGMTTKITAVSNNLGYDDAETEKSDETADTKY